MVVSHFHWSFVRSHSLFLSLLFFNSFPHSLYLYNPIELRRSFACFTGTAIKFFWRCTNSTAVHADINTAQNEAWLLLRGQQCTRTPNDDRSNRNHSTNRLKTFQKWGVGHGAAQGRRSRRRKSGHRDFTSGSAPVFVGQR